VNKLRIGDVPERNEVLKNATKRNIEKINSDHINNTQVDSNIEKHSTQQILNELDVTFKRKLVRGNYQE